MQRRFGASRVSGVREGLAARGRSCNGGHSTAVLAGTGDSRDMTPGVEIGTAMLDDRSQGRVLRSCRLASNLT